MTAVDASARFMEFPRCWEATSGRFTDLQRFCGGLETTSPNIDTVESDFSVLGWEKDNYRTALTKFSPESILHCKKYKCMKELERVVS